MITSASPRRTIALGSAARCRSADTLPAPVDRARANALRAVEHRSTWQILRHQDAREIERISPLLEVAVGESVERAHERLPPIDLEPNAVRHPDEEPRAWNWPAESVTVCATARSAESARTTWRHSSGAPVLRRARLRPPRSAREAGAGQHSAERERRREHCESQRLRAMSRRTCEVGDRRRSHEQSTPASSRTRTLRLARGAGGSERCRAKRFSTRTARRLTKLPDSQPVPQRRRRHRLQIHTDRREVVEHHHHADDRPAAHRSPATRARDTAAVAPPR